MLNNSLLEFSNSLLNVIKFGVGATSTSLLFLSVFGGIAVALIKLKLVIKKETKFELIDLAMLISLLITATISVIIYKLQGKFITKMDFIKEGYIIYLSRSIVSCFIPLWIASEVLFSSIYPFFIKHIMKLLQKLKRRD